MSGDPIGKFWKEVVIVLLSVLLTIGGGYLVLNQRVIAREEAQKIIEEKAITHDECIKIMNEQSPWVIERSGIKEELKGIHDVLNEIKTDLKTKH